MNWLPGSNFNSITASSIATGLDIEKLLCTGCVKNGATDLQVESPHQSEAINHGSSNASGS